ncbi:MAG: Hsp33 family molecular chaperone HslO [Christensenellaceae bacterium]|jgi:molecular chaperone Hsp33|nr:Hsp33 family molecular chaperone HslO [Christensenellaceae bacterium]
MGKIEKAILFGGQARVAVLDTTDIVSELITLHDLSPLSTVCLGRAITIAAYMVGEFKHHKNCVNLIIDGGGPLGKICVSGSSNTVKGFVENPRLESVYTNTGVLNVPYAVGSNGFLTVFKSIDDANPYTGKVPLTRGDIAFDFASYLQQSESRDSAVVLGVNCSNSGCIASGGVIMEPLPGASEEVLYVLEDIAYNLSNISELLVEKTAKEILEFHFAHFECDILTANEISFHCSCSEKIGSIIRSIGKQEAMKIIEDEKSHTLSIKCDYCSREYKFNQSDIGRFF